MNPVIRTWFVIIMAGTVGVYARCCHGFYVNGVRPSGDTECIEAPAGTGSDECIAGGQCRFADDAPRYPIAISCPSGHRPIVVDSMTVGCR